MSSLSSQAFNNLVPLSQKDRRTIVFIDPSIAECESIAQLVIPQARAIIIGSEDNGINAISKVLDKSSCLEIHIFSSSYPGCIRLGNSELSISTFTTYSLELKTWFNTKNLTNSEKSAHIYFYTFSLDIGDAGEEFITKLNRITGAKVSVSSNFSHGDILQDRS